MQRPTQRPATALAEIAYEIVDEFDEALEIDDAVHDGLVDVDALDDGDEDWTPSGDLLPWAHERAFD
ncbi:MAG: hypothetical protein JNM90_06555 [Burkholderiales bacterium]|nr:hypothetical protein [Burkholderiales bacterium]